MLIDTGSADALLVAERIRTEVEASSANGGQPLTISIGVAGYPEDAAARDELLDKADWAMYLAKGAGRNRVLAFGDERVARETWLSRRGRWGAGAVAAATVPAKPPRTGPDGVPDCTPSLVRM